MTWFEIVESRFRAASEDREHPSIRLYAPSPFTKTSTRQEIVDFYETLYGELAEDTVGLRERIHELEDRLTSLQRSNGIRDETIDRLSFELGQMRARFEGIVNLVAQVPAPERPEREQAATDMYAARR